MSLHPPKCLSLKHMKTKSSKTFTILGATGNIGRELCRILLGQGHVVRAVGRNKEKLHRLAALGAIPLETDFTKSFALEAAFAGAHGIFTMIPPGMGEEDYRVFQDRVGEAIASALQKSKATFQVDLSSIGAQHARGVGPIAGLHFQEKRIEQIFGLKWVHLRPGYFMENHLMAVPFIKEKGESGALIRPDLPIVMVATRDIAKIAAEILTKQNLQNTIVEIGGPQEYTLAEAMKTLGRMLGRPEVSHTTWSEEQARGIYRSLGLPQKTMELFIEMAHGFNEGRIVLEKPSRLLRGETTLETFFESVFLSAQGGKQ